MQHIFFKIVSLVALTVAQVHAAPLVYQGTDGLGKGKHIVFLAGDHEYRSEESLPALARILAKHHGFKCTVLFNVNKDTGEIEVGNSNMPGMEALDSADLAVIFLRFQAFPKEQMKHLDDYLNRGGPVVGLRTATHAFKMGTEDPFAKYSYNSKVAGYELGFGHQVLGQTWVGHYGTNHKQSTRITIVEDKKAHPILRGVKDIWVQAGGYVGKPTDGEILTMAQPLNGMTPDSPADEKKPPMPSEWTRTYKGTSGKEGRVFTTLYGTSDDITNEGYRRMVVNGCLWALGMENAIKPDLEIAFIGPFKPNKFGGGAYARGIKPEMYAGYESVIPANANTKGTPAEKRETDKKQDDKKKNDKKQDKPNDKPAATTPAAKPAVVAPVAPPTAPLAAAEFRDPSPFAFKKGDVVAILGNGLPDRMQHDGWMETLLQSQSPDLQLRFRNMSTSGDRPNSYPRSKGALTQSTYLKHVKADVVFAFFGYNESYAGVEKADDHRKQLIDFVAKTRADQPNGSGTPRIVLFSPIAHENTRNPNVPNGKENNVRLEAFTKATEAAAKEAGVAFVDLFHPSLELYKSASTPLTINGVHLTEEGNRQLAEVIARALLGKPVAASSSLEKLREAVLDKDLHWYNRYRASDGNDVWGGRSTLKFVDGQSNAEVLMHELTMFDVMTLNRDPRIWARAAGKDIKIDDSNVPAPISVKSNVGGGSKSSNAGKEGRLEYISGEEGLKQMAVAKGFEVNLFADEAKFPQLINPVQMQVDSKGRVWAAVWPTYPKWEPLKEMNDALIILHDDNSDGRADRVTEFARVQNPLGFEFWNGGVLVTRKTDLVFLKDTNGDDVADQQIIMLQGLDTSDTHHGANNLIMGPDGAIYWQSGVFMQHNHEHPWGPSLQTGASAMYRFDPRRFAISVHAGNSPNPHGTSFDYWGYQYATDGTGGKAYQVRPSGNSFKMTDLLKKEVRPVTASEVVSSANFPDAMQGDFLICNVIGFLGIKHYRLARNPETGAVWGEPVGDELTVTRINADGTKTEDKSRGLLMSGDKNFRPSDAVFGTDGALYVADWHNAIIGHMQHNVRDPNRDHKHGRIYRVTATGRALQKPVAIDGQPIPALLENLKSPIDGIRHRTRVELSERNSREVMAALRNWMNQFDPTRKEDAHALLEALWLHQQHGVKNVTLLGELLKSPEPHARIAAATVQHMWFKVEPSLRGGIVNEAEELAAKKSGILSDTPELTTIRIATVPERMMYDVTQLVVKPGKKIHLTFANDDFMPHNILLVNPGKANEVGELAIALGAKGFDVGYVPQSKEILWSSKLVDYRGEQVIEFTSPKEPGVYEYLCSFPGHHLIMRGQFIVNENPQEYLAKNPTPANKLTEWKLADFTQDLKRVDQHRNFARGKELFTKLACAQCHQLGKEGAVFGPNLSESVKKYKGDSKLLLQEILEPSRAVEDKFRNFSFELAEENPVSGLIVAEDKTSVTIQSGPTASQVHKIEKKSIEARHPSSLSLMPAGLLNSLDKEQILDLLAYLLADGNSDHPAYRHAH